MEEIVRRARGSTRPITLTILIGDDKQDLTGATVTIYVLDTQYYRGTDYDAPYTNVSNYAGPGTLKVDGASATVAANQTTNKGEVTWTPTSTHTDTPGMYWLQPWVVFADSSEDAPEPIRFEVYDSLKALS